MTLSSLKSAVRLTLVGVWLAASVAAGAAAPGADATTAARRLFEARATLATVLGRDGDFRGTEKKPAHGEAFAAWLKVVDRVLKESADGEALGAWQRFRALPPERRAADPLFPAVLEEYAALRYGPDVLTATQRLVRCPTVGRATDSPEAARAFRRAIALVDSLCRVHELSASVSADSLALRISTGMGAPGPTLRGQLDVAPARNGWTFDPWAGLMHGDSLLTGRGATSKGLAMAALFGLRARLDTGAPVAGQPGLLLRRDAESRPEPATAGAPARRERVQLQIGTSFRLMSIAPRGCQWLLTEMSVTHPGDWVPDHAEVRGSPVAGSGSVVYSHMSNHVAQFNQDNSRARISMRREGKVAILAAEGRMADSGAPDEGQNAVVDLVMFLQDRSVFCPSPAVWICTFLAEDISYERSGRGLGVARKDSLGVGTSVCVTSFAASADTAWTELVIHHPGLLSTEEILGKVRERLAIFNVRYQAGLTLELMENPLPMESAADERPLPAPDGQTARRRGIDERIGVETLIRSIGALAVEWDAPRER